MARALFLLPLFFFAACGNDAAAPAAESSAEESYSQFDELFAKGTLPYQLSDTALLNYKDTTQIRMQSFLTMVPDSIRTAVFGNKAKVRFTPMARFEAEKAAYYLVKGTAGAKHAALLAVAVNNEFKAVIPFLTPDASEKTTQFSVLDKALSISRSTLQKGDDDLMAEGKDVFAYNSKAARFDLVMTDPLDDRAAELINPIDTLQKTNKLAGDFQREKRNVVSIRDGRKPGLLTVFIHIDKDKGACTGEIKGDAQITSPTTAVFRQAGDPCVLNLTFSKNSVTLEEPEGCGSRRGIECSFNGTFTRKKEAKGKTGDQKKVRS